MISFVMVYKHIYNHSSYILYFPLSFFMPYHISFSTTVLIYCNVSLCVTPKKTTVKEDG